MFGFISDKCVVLSLFAVVIAGEVIVDFGHYKEPFVKEEGDVTYLQNSNIILQVRCRANYPTKWIYNYDDETRNKNGFLTVQWTDRKFEGSLDDGVYDYIAWIQLQYTTLKETEMLVCTAINDTTGEDQITVSITPISSDNTVSISRTRGHQEGTELKNSSETRSRPSCEIQFSFLNRGSKGSYWRCQGEDGSPGKISFQECGSAMECSNAFRNIKRLSKCLAIVEQSPVSLVGWTEMRADSFKAGTALCSHKNVVRAQTYFFSAPHPENGLRKIEFYWNKIKPSDLVWMDHLKNEYYTNEVLNTICHFPYFGFSFDPYARILQNSTRIKFEKSTENEDDNTWIAKLSYNLTEPGNYEVQCLGPVWDSTEWVNITKRVNVKVSVPPTFRLLSENITFTEGDLSQKIYCSSEGEPKPEIIWENIHIPVISVNGEELYFRKVADYIAGPYSCTAVNMFGQVARKTFNVNVVPKVKVDESGGGIGTSALIGLLSSAFIITLLLIIGFVVFYRKFRKLSGQIAYLTYEEVEHFRDGFNKSPTPDSKEENLNNSSIDCLPYNSKYEVSRDKIIVDENAVLGAGAYGTVIKGTIALPSGTIAVAFKTVPRNVDVSYFKALLSELKILAYIGQHSNVVALIGAWTANIKHREIFVGVELCKTSLVEFLRDNASHFKNCFQEYGSKKKLLGDGSYENMIPTCSTMELLQWSEDIALGMSFLTSKKVVHGDLAARNVLLSFDMQAKICDFGLARQLIDYNYIKSQACPLPWKWMAIESLTQMKFSTHSDAWAYGITLWEIFSLGNIPYAGMTWRTDFVEKLQGGLRMTCPPYANEMIYQIMTNCWNENRSERPSFMEIIKVLKSETNALCIV